MALTGAGSLAWRQGDYARAQALYQDCLSLLRVLGNKQGIADALNSLGLMAWEQGDYARPGAA